MSKSLLRKLVRLSADNHKGLEKLELYILSRVKFLVSKFNVPVENASLVDLSESNEAPQAADIAPIRVPEHKSPIFIASTHGIEGQEEVLCINAGCPGVVNPTHDSDIYRIPLIWLFSFFYNGGWVKKADGEVTKTGRPRAGNDEGVDPVGEEGYRQDKVDKIQRLYELWWSLELCEASLNGAKVEGLIEHVCNAH